ncbi:uncharacterized protein LOC134265165 isoform X2 [Saccostrea cucullata]|uniref:uncharacterized protein LOC134265165 isoform X2 n=1 Tax=Saccostrea cuccullata TaxID=36930 RepID=UPI002ED1F418
MESKNDGKSTTTDSSRASDTGQLMLNRRAKGNVVQEGAVGEEKGATDNELSSEENNDQNKISTGTLNLACENQGQVKLQKTNEDLAAEKDLGGKQNKDPTSLPMDQEVFENISQKSFFKTQGSMTKEDEENGEKYTANVVFNNNLDKKPMDETEDAEITKIFFRFRSGKEKSYNKHLSNIHDLSKWNILLTQKESKNILGKQLEEMQSEIHVAKRKEAPFAFDICSESHEHDFNQWVENCLHLMTESFNATELLFISGSYGEVQHLSKKIKASIEVNDGSVSVAESKDVCGLFLLGRGEHIIDLLSDLQIHTKDVKVWNPYSREDISYYVFHLNTFQLRLISMLNGIKRAKEKHPNVKIYIRREKVMMIGQTEGCTAANDYMKTNAWLTDIEHEEFTAMQEFHFFLKREGVQKYIDSKINSIKGSWAVVEHSDSNNTEMVMIYGKTKSDMQRIEHILQSSVMKRQCINMNSAGVKKNTEKWQECVRNLEDKFEGKIHMQIDKPCDKYVATLVFTSDLQEDEKLRMLLNDIEQQVPQKDTVPMDPKNLTWLQKYYLEDIQTEAVNNDVELKCEEEQGFEITGISSALTDIKKFIGSICMEEQDILLPLNGLPSEVCSFLNIKKCCYDHFQVEDSKCWRIGKTAFIVHKGKKKTDKLFVDVKVQSIQSEDEDFESNIKWSDDTTVFLNIPLWQGGDRKEEQRVNIALELLFSDMVESKKKSVMLESEGLNSWPMENFATCLLHVVHATISFESLIVIMASEDEAEYNSIARCIEGVSNSLKGLQDRNIELQVISGKIAELQEKVDVIVNTTSLNLDLTSGPVSISILEAAGDELKKEMDEIPAIDKSGQRVNKIEYGEVLVTSAYGMNCERLFHGALFPWNDGKDTSLEVLQHFIRNCITKADEMKLKIIAFPAIGTGQLKIPADVVASCMKKIGDEYVRLHPKTSVQKILIVIYKTDEDIFKVFKTILEPDEDKTGKDTAIVLQRFSVRGEKDNVITVMQLLQGLFCKHIQEKYESDKTPKDYEQPSTSPQESDEGREDSTDIPAVVTSDKENKSLSIEDQHYLLLTSTKGTILTMEKVEPILKDVECDNIICPFLEDVCALLRFRSVEDAEKFLKEFSMEDFVLKKFPMQAVTNIKAKLSSKVTGILQQTGITSHEFQKKTGAYLCTESWTVEGNLLMVKNVERCLKEMIKSEREVPSHSIKEKRQDEDIPRTLDEMPKKYTVKCTEFQKRALEELFPDLPFQKVNFYNDVISGTENTVKLFEKALHELTMQEITQVTSKDFKLFESEKKKDAVSVSFAKETNTVVMFSRVPEILQSCLSDFKKLQLSSIEIPVAEFEVIVYFEKLLHKNFTETDGKVFISGPGSLIEQYKYALNNVRHYTKEYVTVSDYAKYEATLFVSKLSSENGDVFVRITGNTIFITGPRAESVKKVKYEAERLAKQNVRNQAGKRGSNSTDVSRNSKGGLPEYPSQPVSPKTSDIVFDERGVKVYVFKANITHVNADAIVNPLNKTLHSHGGLSSFIFREAGQSVRSQCSEFIKHQKEGTLPIGKTFVTGAGKLQFCQKIVHVNVPVWESYAKSENPCDDCMSDIISTVQACLSQVDDVYAIAIPAISAGALSAVPLTVCCMAYAKAVNSFVVTKSTKSKLKEIYFVDTDQAKLQGIKNSLLHKQHWVYHKAGNEKDFYLDSGLVVKIFSGEIILLEAGGLVIEQDRDMRSKRGVAEYLTQCKSDKYKNEMGNFRGKYWTISNVRSTCAPETLPNIKEILHVFTPEWSIMKDTDPEMKIMEELEVCIKKIFKMANDHKLKTLLIPLFGREIDDKTRRRKIFQCTANAVVKCGTEKTNSIQKISLVDNDDVIIAHMIANFSEVLSKDAEKRNKLQLINVARSYT